MAVSVANGYIYQYLTNKIIRVEGNIDNEAYPKDGSRLILDHVIQNMDKREFNFEVREGFEPFGYIRHVKSQKLVCANGDKLEIHAKENGIVLEALFAFNLEDKTIVPWRTEKVWNAGNSGKLELTKQDEAEMRYFFGNENADTKRPYPDPTKSWKLLKAIVAPNHKGSIEVKYTVGIAKHKSKQIMGQGSANLKLTMKIAEATFGSTLSMTKSESTEITKNYEATIRVDFGDTKNTTTTSGGVSGDSTVTTTPPCAATCVWQLYRGVPNIGIEVGFLSDIIVVTKDCNPPTMDDETLELLLNHRVQVHGIYNCYVCMHVCSFDILFVNKDIKFYTRVKYIIVVILATLF